LIALDYFTNKIHFAGHYVAMYGYDETFAYLVDTKQQGCEMKKVRWDYYQKYKFARRNII